MLSNKSIVILCITRCIVFSGCGPTPKRRLSLSSFDFTPVAAPSHGFQARRASVVESEFIYAIN